MMSLRESTPALEGPLLVSKLLKIPALLDGDEMRSLFYTLSPFALYQVSDVCIRGEESLSHEVFLEGYETYISSLKRAEVPSTSFFRHLFSSVMTVSDDALYALALEGEKRLVKPIRPVVQMQPNSIQYSSEDGQFRSKIFGSEGLTWGIHFSYPQLFQNSKTQEIYKVRQTPDFPNTALFKALQRWIRHHTVPTPFLVEGKRINSPIRLGKACFSWIKAHPQLKERGISIDGA